MPGSSMKRTLPFIASSVVGVTVSGPPPSELWPSPPVLDGIGSAVVDLIDYNAGLAEDRSAATVLDPATRTPAMRRNRQAPEPRRGGLAGERVRSRSNASLGPRSAPWN